MSHLVKNKLFFFIIIGAIVFCSFLLNLLLGSVPQLSFKLTATALFTIPLLGLIIAIYLRVRKIAFDKKRADSFFIVLWLSVLVLVVFFAPTISAQVITGIKNIYCSYLGCITALLTLIYLSTKFCLLLTEKNYSIGKFCLFGGLFLVIFYLFFCNGDKRQETLVCYRNQTVEFLKNGDCIRLYDLSFDTKEHPTATILLGKEKSSLAQLKANQPISYRSWKLYLTDCSKSTSRQWVKINFVKNPWEKTFYIGAVLLLIALFFHLFSILFPNLCKRVSFL